MREGQGNINFVLIGAKATGKTVYLASLYLNSKYITSKDARTLEYLKPLANELLDGKYPQATAGTLHELKFNYKDDNFVCNIQIDDVDGYFIETLHKDDKNTQKERDNLLKNIKNSEGIIFFFPYETSFNEESIRDFNYEIDTVISKIRDMYKDRDTIPIPAVIAVSKWDKSPYYQAENELEKAIEYIEENQFLRLAKEKIENNFPSLKIIPISSIGKDIKNMKPHNIEEPLKFFLSETYKIWDEKIEKLKSKKDELLKFLNIIYTDMKHYKNGKYTKLYDETEKEISNKLLSEVRKIDNYQLYKKFQEKYANTIKYLKPDSQQKIEDIAKKLKSKQTKKRATGTTITLGVLAIVIFGGIAWYAKVKLTNSEGSLYERIILKNRKGDLKGLAPDIKRYESQYSNNDKIDLKHKEKVLQIKVKLEKKLKEKFDAILKEKSLYKQYDDLKAFAPICKSTNLYQQVLDKLNEIRQLKQNYESLISFSIDKNNLNIANNLTTLKKLTDLHYTEARDLEEKYKKMIISTANNILSDNIIEHVDIIDNVLKALVVLGVDNKELTQKLINKKNKIKVNEDYEKLKKIADSNYGEAIKKIEDKWNDQFTEEQKKSIIKKLNNGFNVTVKDLLDKLDKINDYSDFEDYKNTIDKINNLLKNTKIEKINFKPVLEYINKKKFEIKQKYFKSYDDAINYGIYANNILFTADKEDNKPLGFSCDGDHDIIMTIDNVTYDYHDATSCNDLKISWKNQGQKFIVGKYSISIIEQDIFSNDGPVVGTIKLDEDDIIHIKNGKFRIDLTGEEGNMYHIKFK